MVKDGKELSREAPAELRLRAAFGFERALWTRELIADLIEQRFGVRFQADRVGEFVRRLGFSPQRPQYRAGQRDPGAVKAWREQVYPDIRAQAAQLGATIYFGDEAHLPTDVHAGTTRASICEPPVMTATGKREPVNMISAMEQRGSIHFTVHRGRCDAAVFIESCKDLSADDGGTVLLILDDSRIHRAKATGRFAEPPGIGRGLFRDPNLAYSRKA